MDTEERVRLLLARGDYREAATEAIRGLGPEVHRYLRARLREEDDVADAFSHWAEAVWRGLPRFRGECSLRTWALRLAANVAANVFNEAWRRRVRRFYTGEASAIADEVRRSSLVRVERRAQRFEALRHLLSAQDRLLFELRLDRGRSWKQIAEVFGRAGQRVSPAALAKRFERLKAWLAQMAREQGPVD